MTIDVSALSAQELDALINQAKRRQTALRKRKSPAIVRKRVEALVAAEGYSLAELYTVPGNGRRTAAKRAATTQPASRKGRKLGKVAPKYRNPANTKETWTGRGLPPRWMADQIKKGKKKEDFLIKK
jgi:DNA-binding protein H-NS